MGKYEYAQIVFQLKWIEERSLSIISLSNSLTLNWRFILQLSQTGFMMKLEDATNNKTILSKVGKHRFCRNKYPENGNWLLNC